MFLNAAPLSLHPALISNSVSSVCPWLSQFHIVFLACYIFQLNPLLDSSLKFIISINYFDSVKYYLFVSFVHCTSARVKYSPPIHRHPNDDDQMKSFKNLPLLSPTPPHTHRIMMTLIKPHSPRVFHHPFLNVPTFENSSHSTRLIIYTQTLSGGHHKWTAGTSPAKGVWKGLIRTTTNWA